MRLTHNPNFILWLAWFGLAIILLGFVIGLRAAAPFFHYGINLQEMPIAALAASYVGVGILFFFMLPQLIGASSSLNTKHVFLLMILTGLMVRIGFLGAPTILEDDYNRYLWDGAVTASGENPYAYSPDEIEKNRKDGGVFDLLIKQSDGVFERINFPQFSTVYPPAAQAIFALTHFISPFNLDALRSVLLVFEVGCLAVIIALLRHFTMSPLWSALYWWNPLIIKEVSNSAHMEPFLMLPVLVASYLILKKRFHFASVMLAIAAGIKVWPALLAIVIWRQLLPNFKQILLNGALFGMVLGVMILPIVISGLSQNSGFVAFGGQWQASSAIYLVSEWVAYNLTPYWVDDYLEIPLISRILLGISLIIVIALLCLKRAVSNDELLWRMFLIITAVYLLTPSQTPWYFVWLAPFLCVFRVRGLLLAGALIPLHYSYFHYASRGLEDTYHYGIVWLIWVPVWILLAYEVVKNRLSRPGTGAMAL